jgi:hypothetical protein
MRNWTVAGSIDGHPGDSRGLFQAAHPRDFCKNLGDEYPALARTWPSRQ